MILPLRIPIASIPCLTMDGLSLFSRRGTLQHGISIYNGTIIVWDEDHDERVIQFLNEGFANGIVPLAVSESEGLVHLLWDARAIALNESKYDGYDVGWDWWNSANFFIDENGTVLQLEEESEKS